MSTADKLTSILNSKTAIKNAIEGKGVTVGEAPLANYASLIGQIETGGSSSSSPSSGPATDLFLAFNNNFNAGGNSKYTVIKGEMSYQMDWETSGWGGNFTADQDFGYVLTFPNQDQGEEWDRVAYDVRIPFNIWAWIQDNTSWTCEFWHKKGTNWNTYSQSQILEASDCYGMGFSLSYNNDRSAYGFRIIGMDNWSTQYNGIANDWNHVALVCNEGTLYFYVNGVRVIDNISLNISNPNNSYLPSHGFYIGFTSTSDYRDFSFAKLRFSNIARYTGATFTPSKSYTAQGGEINNSSSSSESGQVIVGSSSSSSQEQISSSSSPAPSINSYFYMPLTTDSNAIINGQTVNQTGWDGTHNFTSINGVNACYFDGARIDTTLNADFWYQNNACTISMMVYQTGNSRTGYFAATTDCWFGVDSIGDVYSQWSGSSNDWMNLQSDWDPSEDGSGWGRSETSVIMNAWTHIAFVKTLSSCKLYINGTLVKNNDVGFQFESQYVQQMQGPQYLRIGAWGNDGERFTGYMKNVRVFTSALSASEVANVYAADSN